MPGVAGNCWSITEALGLDRPCRLHHLGAPALRFAGSAPNLVSGLSVSAPNVGIAVGSWAAGTALSSPLGQAGPPLVGTVAAALTLVPLTALALMRTSRSETPPPRSGVAAEQSMGRDTHAVG
ncbi:hypothetical protein [Streptomyces sp. NPDC050759]|uniref:hypothetical protein n=1 Tax=Streptomyces sp. NPDC050759 TaxID=3365635 RepID=UPI003792B539